MATATTIASILPYGAEIPYSKKEADPRISAGLRLRIIRAYYTHQQANTGTIVNAVLGNAINANTVDVGLASPAGHVLSNNGVGADFGLQTALWT